MTTNEIAPDWLAVAHPVARRGTLPLRVSVYAAMAKAIRSGSPAPSSLLPFEADLCVAFGVSRTVMREALLLLEEDGLIRTRRGVGRFVADRLPEIGLERLQSLEELLSTGGADTQVEALRREEEATTDFTSRGLDLPDYARTWFWESLIRQDGDPVALSQEWIPAGDRLVEVSPLIAARIGDNRVRSSTLLARINDIVGPVLGPGSCEISVSTAGAARGALFGATARSPILVLSHVVLLEGRAIYLGKHMIRAEVGRIHVVQSAQS
jgi:GntR family transcriptional regulator